jgi:hypothetical protein
MPLLEPTEITVKAVIEQSLKMHCVPMYCTFQELGVSPFQINELRNKVLKIFDKNVEISFNDTINSVTEKLV